MLNEGLVRNRESFFVGHIPIGKDGEHERELDLRSRLLSLGIVHASTALRSLLHRLQREVNELRNEVAELRHAIQKINFVFLCHASA